MKSLALLIVLLAGFLCVYGLKLDFSHSDTPHKDCAHHAHHSHTLHGKIEKLNKGEPADANDGEYKRHLLCVWKEKGVMSEDGTLQKDVIETKVAKISGGNVEDEKKVTNCAVQKANPEETAVTFYNCVAPLVKKYNSL